MIRPAFALLLPLVMATPVAAQTAKGPCDDAASTVEISACFERELKKADADLNRVYSAAMRSIDASSEMDAKVRDAWKAGLRDAQRAWITFRDNDCKQTVPYEWYGGTGAGGAVLSCLLDLTQERTKSLRQRYEAK